MEGTPIPPALSAGEPRASEGAGAGGASGDAGNVREETPGCFLRGQRTTRSEATLQKGVAPRRWPCSDQILGGRNVEFAGQYTMSSVLQCLYGASI